MQGRGFMQIARRRRSPVTVTIGNNTGDDYSGIEDNRIDNNSPDNTWNMGAHTKGYCGIHIPRIMKELHRWNLADVPAGSTIISASLFLYDTNWSMRLQNCTINLYEIADANGDWVVGTAIDAAQVGSACWNVKVYNTVNWAGAAGLATPGTDFVNTSLGSAIFTDGVSGYREIPLNAAGLAILMSWFGAAANNGIIIVGTGSTDCWTEWHSSQAADGFRPYLSITYI